MKIRSIHIYSHDGRRRDLLFHDGLNVITGRSSTGKSALSDIIEYCMGRSTFNIPEGIIQERVSWYAVRYAFEGEEVLVAKPAPGLGRSSCSLAMVRRGIEVAVPTLVISPSMTMTMGSKHSYRGGSAFRKTPPTCQ
jgi:hypothetical protein